MDPADLPSGFSLPPAAEADTDPSAEQGPALAGLARGIWLRPAAAMRSLAAHPDRRWIAPLSALVIVSVISAMAAMPGARDHQRLVMRAEIERSEQFLPEGQSADELLDVTTTGPLGMALTVISVVGGLLAPVLAVAVIAAVLHLLATVLGGQQSYAQMFTVTSWARLPLVLGGLVLTAFLLTGHYDPNPDGLSGLVAADPLARDGQTGLVQPLLAQLELWNLWYLALLALGVQAAGRVSRSKAVAAVAVLVALEIGLGLAGLVIGRVASFG